MFQAKNEKIVFNRSVIEICVNVHCSVIGLRQWVRANSMQVLRLQRPAPLVLHRHQSDTSAQNTTDGERRIITKLQQTFPKAAEIRVHDISGLFSSICNL